MLMTIGLFFRLYVSQRLNSPSLLTDGYSLLHLHIQLSADIIRLSPTERKAMEMRRHGLFRRHLGNGYCIVVMYHYSCLVLDFRQPCKVSTTGRRTFSAIFPSRKSIEINLHDEWEYLLDEVIPGIFHNHPKFTALLPPRRECLW